MSALVSIIIPTLNRASLLPETLDSVLAQSYSDWECIIVDDGSEDNTHEIVQTYINRDKRFQTHNRPQEHEAGGSGARNYGFKLSKGEYIVWLDSDDLFHPDYLKEQMAVLENKKHANWVVCESYIFEDQIENRYGKLYESNIITHNDPLKYYVLRKLNIHTSAALFRKKFLEHIKFITGLFNEKLKQSQEWELFSRILYYDSGYLILEREFLFIRKNPKSITSDYYKQKEEIAYSQIIALKSVHDFLERKNKLDIDLTTFFINSGVTVMKRAINNKHSVELQKLCEQFISECLSNKLSDHIYEIKFGLGKFFWKNMKRGHKLLSYP